jgi:hypothetical protein
MAGHTGAYGGSAKQDDLRGYQKLDVSIGCHNDGRNR